MKKKELDELKVVEENIDGKDFIHETFTFNLYYI